MMTLSNIKERSAVSYNNKSMKRIGWAKQFAKVANLLAINGIATRQSFAQSLATWQGKQTPPLKPDGKLGKMTWRRMQPMLVNVAGVGTLPTWVKQTPARPPQSEIAPQVGLGGLNGASWMGIARHEMNGWDQERSGMTAAQQQATEEFTDVDESYFAASPRWGNVTHDIGVGPGRGNRDWCAAFVNYCLHRAGFSHTGSAGAASFAKRHLWSFDSLEEPRVGCVIVLGERPGSHVGFLADVTGLPTNPQADVAVRDLPRGGVRLLGGNQMQRVCENTYRRSLLSARGDNGVISPYFWPLQGTPNCNISFTTARAHGCSYTHNG